ncbi:YbaK/EbsC family protein [Candidatus Bathyarchaeota archaeon]|nr:YbaK/EbsC family protein [Candidatus Bathyarchaeota archaeon]
MRLILENILVARNIPYRIIELKDRAITVSDVIEHSMEDISSEEICKTILVKQKTRYYAVFLRGADKIDFKKLKDVIGKVSIASRKEVVEVTGVEPGAVCPLLVDIPVLVDRRVLRLKKLNFGSGDHLFGVEIASGDLELVLDYRLVEIAE